MTDSDIVERLAGPVVVSPPADLPDRDKRGWDLAVQAYILATRDHNREAAATITALREEVEEARKERDNALTARDVATESQNDLSAALLDVDSQLATLTQRVREWQDARKATLAEPVGDVRTSPSFRDALNRLSSAEDALARTLLNELKETTE